MQSNIFLDCKAKITQGQQFWDLLLSTIMASLIGSAPQTNGNTESIKWVCSARHHSFGDVELNCQDIRPTPLGISHLWEDLKCKVLYMQLHTVDQKITNFCASIHTWVCKICKLQRWKISPYTYSCLHIILQVGFGWFLLHKCVLLATLCNSLSPLNGP